MSLGFEPRKKGKAEDTSPVEDMNTVEKEESTSPLPKNNKKEIPINTQNKNNDTGKLVIIVCVSVVLVLFLVVGFMYVKSKAKSKQVVEPPPAPVVQKPDDKEVKPGLPNLNASGSQKNNSSITSSDNILKDLNNKTVDTNYTIKNITTVVDFISYEKHRATTASGLEFYWLEAIYKDRPYKVQVSYQIYKELDNKGITVVDAEVVTLDNNSQLVTYMKVRSDYKKLLERK